MPGDTVAMIRIDMTQQNSNHPDKRRRHQGRAWCEVAGGRFETRGPAPIYRMATLLWLHCYGGAEFEVWDNLSPFGKPGGLAMTGRVRNWASFETPNGKPMFAVFVEIIRKLHSLPIRNPSTNRACLGERLLKLSPVAER